MDIIHEENLFYIGNPEEPLAKLEYAVENNKIQIIKIYVVAHLKGQGISNDLVQALLKYAREQNYIFDPNLVETSSIKE